jgi:hypothetical protein
MLPTARGWPCLALNAWHRATIVATEMVEFGSIDRLHDVGHNNEAVEQGDAADEAFGGTVARIEVPPHARAVPFLRGHRFAADRRCCADNSWGSTWQQPRAWTRREGLLGAPRSGCAAPSGLVDLLAGWLNQVGLLGG